MLTPTDEAMLLACARYQYLTAEQWCRYFEDPGKLRYVQRRSRELAAQEYLIRLYLARAPGAGKAPSVFALGPQGRALAKSHGVAVPRRFRPIDLKTLSPKHLAHSVALTDVLLRFDLLARHDERITIADMRHERLLHEQRFKVTVPFVQPVTGVIEERVVEVVPDAFVRVIAQVGDAWRSFPLVIEVDRDTEEQIDFREKIANLYTFGLSKTYERLYEARSFNVVFFIQAPRRDPLERLAEVLAWAERELRQRRLEHESVSFSFCALDPATTPPDELLLGEQWFHPFGSSPHTLIDLAESPKGGV
jgi:hypothetical protein